MTTFFSRKNPGFFPTLVYRAEIKKKKSGNFRIFFSSLFFFSKIEKYVFYKKSAKITQCNRAKFVKIVKIVKKSDIFPRVPKSGKKMTKMSLFRKKFPEIPGKNFRKNPEKFPKFRKNCKFREISGNFGNSGKPPEKFRSFSRIRSVSTSKSSRISPNFRGISGNFREFFFPEIFRGFFVKKSSFF